MNNNNKKEQILQAAEDMYVQSFYFLVCCECHLWSKGMQSNDSENDNHNENNNNGNDSYKFGDKVIKW